MLIHMLIHIYIYKHTCMCIYKYIDREREGERERERTRDHQGACARGEGCLRASLQCVSKKGARQINT